MTGIIAVIYFYKPFRMVPDTVRSMRRNIPPLCVNGLCHFSAHQEGIEINQSTLSIASPLWNFKKGSKLTNHRADIARRRRSI